MFRFFETLVDPYTAYPQDDTPPQRVWLFLRAYSQPFLKIFALTACMSVVVAAIEVGLIYYMGRVVDLLEQGQEYDEAVDEYRWLLEEFRVSLFAQQLGTRAKVSIKRLQDAWKKID